MSYLFTLTITCLGLSFMAIKGPTVEVSPEVSNYRTLKLTSEKMGPEYSIWNGNTIYCRFYMHSLWEHIR